MKILNMRKIENGRSLVATFDVQFAPLTVRGMAVFRKADGQMWISEPSESFQGRDGKTSYKKHVIITDEHVRQTIEHEAKAMLAELEWDQPF